MQKLAAFFTFGLGAGVNFLRLAHPVLKFSLRRLALTVATRLNQAHFSPHLL